jgi:hypothetical protein
MNYGEVAPLLCIAGLVAILIPIYFVRLQTAKTAIQEYLEIRGATDIRIQHNLLDGDRGTLTFRVEYKGVKGTEQTARCKTLQGIFSNNELFWTSLDDLNTLQDQANPSIPINNQISQKIHTHSTIKLPSYKVIKVLPIPGTKDQIVLLDYTQSFQNLLRCDVDGETIWYATLPTLGDDAYTNVEWRNGELSAFSKSCMAVTLDVNTGQIL